MSLRNLLEPEIFASNDRDFANWLKAGIPVYTGAKAPMPGDRVPDAFPYARGFIGRNEAGLAADLKNIYDLLPSVTQVEMERGVTLLWSETEFKDTAQFDIGRTLLEFACLIQVKSMVDFLPDSLTFLAIALEQDTTPATKRQVLELRWLAFQAAIELTSASGRSIRCLEQFMEDDTFSEPLLARGQALEILRYLAIKLPHRLVYWAGIFGRAIVADFKASDDRARDIRSVIDAAYGREKVEAVVFAVRERSIMQVQTEDGALSMRSLRSLYDLVPILHRGREGATDEDEVDIPVWPWDASETPPTKPGADVVDINFRREMKGR